MEVPQGKVSDDPEIIKMMQFNSKQMQDLEKNYKSSDEDDENKGDNDNPKANKSKKKEDELEKFDKKIKDQRQDQQENDSDENEKELDDKDDEELKKIFEQMKLKGNSQQKPSSLSIQKIQENIVTQKMAQQQSSEDNQLKEILTSGNDSLLQKKIKELVQKNRYLQVQCDKEKNLRQKMENELNRVLKDQEDQIKLKEQQFPQQQFFNGDLTKKSVQKDEKLKKTQQKEDTQLSLEDWKKKYQEADKKIQELRVQLNYTKNELNKANRVITREIGENFNVDKVLLEENSWKGRAQQIEKLKAKVKTLQQQVGQQSSMTSTNMFSESQMPVDKALAQTAQDKRKEFEQLKEQNEKLKQENELLSGKVKGFSSRKTVLENEMKDMKADFEKNKVLLIQKSESDDKYIQALKIEIDKIRKMKIEPKVIYKNQCDHEQRETTEVDKENTKLKKDLTYLKDELEKKEAMIKELIQEKIRNNQSSLSQVQESNNNSSSDPNIVQELNQKVKKLDLELRIYKKERDEFFNQSIKDKDNQLLIKDLSQQNAKLRIKIDDLQKQLTK